MGLPVPVVICSYPLDPSNFKQKKYEPNLDFHITTFNIGNSKQIYVKTDDNVRVLKTSTGT